MAFALKKEREMTKDQKTVAIGAASGIVAMLAALFGLSNVMPDLATDAETGERLAFAAKWIALACAPLFVAIGSIGNARFNSEAIDPTAGKESRAMIINGRVVDNTVQQYLMFVSASFAVAACGNGAQLGTVSGAAIIFVVARVAFWIGYRIRPVYRAFGMAATSYLCLALFAHAAWLAWWPQ